MATILRTTTCNLGSRARFCSLMGFFFNAGWEGSGGEWRGGEAGPIFAGRVRPSSSNSSEAEAGNGLLPFCLASVLLFIREEQNRQRITIGKL